ncbi:MAG: putative nucleotidyltransferase [Caulobacteraceae bacterium]|nr:putative nucleotidyltransferase [Caulobacteraceae bacterium]
MHVLLEENRDEIAELCRRYGVRRLEAFGSVARGQDFDPGSSDADFLVTFENGSEHSGLARFLGLAEALEALLGRPVDLVERGTIEASRNSIRKRSILGDAETVYG